MLPQADYLVKLIKNEIDKIVEKNQKINLFLAWLDEKSASVKSKKYISNLKAIGQVFYFNLIVKRSTILKRRKVSKDFLLDSELIKVLNFCLDIQKNIILFNELTSNSRKKQKQSKIEKKYKAIFSSIEQCILKTLDVEFKEKLTVLKVALPGEIETSQTWWLENLQQWLEQFRAAILEHRNIGHDWDFTESEIKALKEYYDVNKLLAKCLKGDCYVSREVREEINRSTLLPIDKL